MKRVASACLLASALTLLPSCIGIGGTSNTTRPTVGQELIDLKAALDRGAITQAEYAQQKAILMSRPRN